MRKKSKQGEFFRERVPETESTLRKKPAEVPFQTAG
jgi:hypothetical protein